MNATLVLSSFVETTSTISIYTMWLIHTFVETGIISSEGDRWEAARHEFLNIADINIFTLAPITTQKWPKTNVDFRMETKNVLPLLLVWKSPSLFLRRINKKIEYTFFVCALHSFQVDSCLSVSGVSGCGLVCVGRWFWFRYMWSVVWSITHVDREKNRK